MKPRNDLARIIGILKSSPLSQLSLSSRELFHSNFLAWLCERYKPLGYAVFGRFVPGPRVGIKEVKREKKNIDLWLDFTNGEQLIIENKIKSVPGSSQLEEYSAKVGSDHTSFVLLSLSRPLFLSSSDSVYKDRNGVQWHYLSYADLAKFLSEALRDSSDSPPSYHRQIIEDYIEYARALHDLYDHYSIGENSTDCFFAPNDDSSLHHDRLYSGVFKMRYAQLAEMLKQELQSRSFNTFSDELAFWKGGEGSVLIYSGMTRATGLLGFHYLLLSERDETPLALGVQLQNDKFRLVVASHKPSAKRAAEFLADETDAKRHWFDFSHLILPTYGPECPEIGFNKFGDVFFYRYKQLGRGISSRAIVQAIAVYAELIRSNSRILRERVMSTF